MAKKFTNLFCVFIVCLISIVSTSSLILAQERRMGSGIRETALELQRLIQEKQSEGADVSRALELDRRSQEAIERGRPQECLRLLRKAIVLLQGDKQKLKARLRNDLNYEDSPFGFHPAIVVPPFEYGIDNPYAFAIDIGVKWDRSTACMFIWTLIQPDLTKDEYQWGRYDELMRQVPDSITVMANIFIGNPRRDFNYDKYARDKTSFVPRDIKAYKRYVRAIIERYDGDGIDDMPGLSAPIEYWQVDNEPPHRLKDYAEFLSITYSAIKEADPDAKVIIGGVAGLGSPKSMSGYRDSFDRSYLPILKDLSKIGKRSFDIFDFHWYGDASGYYLRIKDIHNYIKQKIEELKIPLPEEYWITEMGTYSGDPEPVIIGGITAIPGWPYQSERQQAVDLVKKYVYPLSLGIKRIFMAFGIKEGFKKDKGYFDFTGLIYDGKYEHDKGKGVKKLAYYTYKKMVEVLEGSDWSNIQRVRESDGIYIYKFIKNDKPIWVAWNDNKEPRRVTFTLDRSTENVRITEGVPKYESGKDVRDYNTAFKEIKGDIMESYPLQLGFELGENPVFVEEVYKTAGTEPASK